jgi:hypothetical protein
MNETIKKEGKILWVKAILNGFLVFLIGFIIYMIPSFVVAFKIAFKLGPTLQDPALISSQISQAISVMYENNWYLTSGFIVITSILIFWRAYAISRNTWDKSVVNGLIVGAVPALFTLLFLLFHGIDPGSIIEIILFLAAGAAAGSLGVKKIM